MRYLITYKGIYLGLLLVNFYIYHFLRGNISIYFPASLAKYYPLFILLHILYFIWNSFNFSRIWRKKVTGIVLMSEKIICVGGMTFPILSGISYHFFSPSGYAYSSINHIISVTFGLYKYSMAPIVYFYVVNLVLEILYFRYLLKCKRELSSNLTSSASPS